jgi:hypothetical protein
MQRNVKIFAAHYLVIFFVFFLLQLKASNEWHKTVFVSSIFHLERIKINEQIYAMLHLNELSATCARDFSKQQL